MELGPHINGGNHGSNLSGAEFFHTPICVSRHQTNSNHFFYSTKPSNPK
jgi:hypothetical protein